MSFSEYSCRRNIAWLSNHLSYSSCLLINLSLPTFSSRTPFIVWYIQGCANFFSIGVKLINTTTHLQKPPYTTCSHLFTASLALSLDFTGLAPVFNSNNNSPRHFAGEGSIAGIGVASTGEAPSTFGLSKIDPPGSLLCLIQTLTHLGILRGKASLEVKVGSPAGAGPVPSMLLYRTVPIEIHGFNSIKFVIEQRPQFGGLSSI